MKKIELLAPVGNMDALKAAVENGADAVYLGGERFNARKNAENFTMKTFAEALEYAHKRNVKTYATVNTLLGNHEVLDFLSDCYDMAANGIDGFIVQDLGVVELLQNTLPEVPLHASTQMVVHNLAGVKYLEEMGFKRAVLARETSLKDIEFIIKNTTLEIETFVHGALCVCYSGQCLMSSFIGGRSGNRGVCAQPCRMEYDLLDQEKNKIWPIQEGKHLLSPQELNMIDYLPQLLQAGIHSLKIEGRMKRPEYVAITVNAYRKAIDACYGEGQGVSMQDKKDMLQIFNRGFTTGYYFHKLGRDMMCYQKPNNQGIQAGEVLDCKKNIVTVKLDEPIRQSDGYVIHAKEEIGGNINHMRLNHREIQSAAAGDIVQFPVKGYVEKGAILYKTSDSELLQRALKSFAVQSQAEKTPIDFYFSAHVNQPMKLIAMEKNGNYAETQSEYIAVIAQNHPADNVYIEKQLSRLGNTDYVLDHLEVTMDENLMLPASELNKLRRDVMDMLLQKQTSIFPSDYTKEDYLSEVEELLDTIPPQVIGYTKTQLALQVTDLSALKTAVDAGSDMILAHWHSFHGYAAFSLEDIKEGINYCHDHHATFWIILQNIAENGELAALRDKLQFAKDHGADGIYVSNIGLLQMAKEMGWENIASDYTMNITNDLAIRYLTEQGISRATLSIEMNLEQIKELSYLGNVPIEMIVHGNFPLMTSAYCPIGAIAGGKNQNHACSQACIRGKYGLKDRMNMVFPIVTDHACRMYLLNTKTLNSYDKIQDILSAQPDVIRIIADRWEESKIKIVTEAYHMARLAYWNNGFVHADEKVEKQLQSLHQEGCTHGHYYRGI